MGSTTCLRFVAISGSIRKASWHSGLLRAAIEIARDELPDVEIEVLEIGHLPYVNTDLERENRVPDVVKEFKEKVLQADAVIFASPEYNFSVTAVLKNAIDWASRPPNAWADKPAAIISAARGVLGGARGQTHLRDIGVFLNLHFLNKPEIFIKALEAPQKFDTDGNLIDGATRGRVKELIVALREWTLRLQKN